jgi:hypothetical protein
MRNVLKPKFCKSGPSHSQGQIQNEGRDGTSFPIGLNENEANDTTNFI